MVPAFNPMSCPNLAISAEVMQHVINVESGGNPFAIGVVNARLERQPRNLSEAVATVRMLEASGYNYSLGLAQVNRSNLARYGLNTYDQAFDGCANLAAGARILGECYGRSNHDWGRAFSCYYSGDFVAGYHDGYVKRIYGSLEAGRGGTQPIIVYAAAPKYPRVQDAAAISFAKHDAGYLVAMRSIAVDALGDSLASAIAPSVAQRSPTGTVAPHEPSAAVADAPTDNMDRPFIPHVSGPADRDGNTAASAAALHGPSSSKKAVAPQTGAPPEAPDAAFVF